MENEIVKTEYRIRTNGHWSWLEYKQKSKYFFNLFTDYEWIPVPKPYYDKVWGRRLVLVASPDIWAFVTSDFEWFVKKYPDINVYMKDVYLPQQKELEDKAKKYWDEIEKKKNEIIYL